MAKTRKMGKAAARKIVEGLSSATTASHASLSSAAAMLAREASVGDHQFTSSGPSIIRRGQVVMTITGMRPWDKKPEIVLYRFSTGSSSMGEASKGFIFKELRMHRNRKTTTVRRATTKTSSLRNPRGHDAYSTQPALKKRKLQPIGTVGDMSPVEYGGGVVYKGPGKDEYELHYFQPYDGNNVSVYRFDIEPNVITDLSWVDWNDIARSIGMSAEELKGYARSSNVMARASVYEAVGNHHGFSNLDSYPLESKIETIDRRYDKDINKAHRVSSTQRNGTTVRLAKRRRNAHNPKAARAKSMRFKIKMAIKPPPLRETTTAYRSELVKLHKEALALRRKLTEMGAGVTPKMPSRKSLNYPEKLREYRDDLAKQIAFFGVKNAATTSKRRNLSRFTCSRSKAWD